jgi:tRNAThr (cytosine32-N3)-methyltransferase
MSIEVEQAARQALGAAHATDPRTVGGRPREAVYAARVEAWVSRLVDSPGLALRLAAQAQHLERWAIPRRDYPEGRGGYLRWRSAVHQRQGLRASELLLAAGCEVPLAEHVQRLVAKATPQGDPEAQALEDAACLVFLETELGDFVRKHEQEKVAEILRKTWTRRMSPRARELALALDLAPQTAELVRAALA